MTRASLLTIVRPLLKWKSRPVGTHLYRKVGLPPEAIVNIMLPSTWGPTESIVLKSAPMPWSRVLVLALLLVPTGCIGVGCIDVSRKSFLALSLACPVWNPFLIRTCIRLLEICTIRPTLVIMLHRHTLLVPGLLVPTLPRVTRNILDPPCIVYLIVVTSPL